MKKIILPILLFVLILPAVAIAAPDIGTNRAEQVATGAGYEQANELSLSTQIGKYIRVALSLSGMIFLVLTVYAGILWMTAAGNEDKVTEAKGIITRASIGILITLAAFSITAFILAITGAATTSEQSQSVGSESSGGCTSGFFSCWVEGFKKSALENPAGVPQN